MAGRYPSGGSAGLAQLVDEYGESLLADFQRYYGLNLRLILLGDGHDYPPGHLFILAKTLPPESRTSGFIRGGEDFVGWGLDRYISVAVLEAIRENTWAIVAANSKRKPKEPEAIPRPDDKHPKPKPKNNIFRQMAATHIAAAKQAKAEQGG